MNVERILALADLISTLNFVEPYASQTGFTMSHFVSPRDEDGEELANYDCGTPACMAGWASWLVRGRPATMREQNVFEEASEYLEISRDMAWKLFIPSDLPEDLSLDDITQYEAAKVLRNLAKTGEVDWQIIR